MDTSTYFFLAIGTGIIHNVHYHFYDIGAKFLYNSNGSAQLVSLIHLKRPSKKDGPTSLTIQLCLIFSSFLLARTVVYTGKVVCFTLFIIT